MTDFFFLSIITRAFLTKSYPTMKKHNPSIPILLREANGTLPKVYARYEFGQEKSQSLEGTPDIYAHTTHTPGEKKKKTNNSLPSRKNNNRPERQTNRGHSHWLGTAIVINTNIIMKKSGRREIPPCEKCVCVKKKKEKGGQGQTDRHRARRKRKRIREKKTYKKRDGRTRGPQTCCWYLPISYLGVEH